jgi:hypothetical protein
MKANGKSSDALRSFDIWSYQTNLLMFASTASMFTPGKVKAAGGMIHRPPTDIPNVGRFAVASDQYSPSRLA